jgi:hypothetical protein
MSAGIPHNGLPTQQKKTYTTSTRNCGKTPEHHEVTLALKALLSMAAGIYRNRFLSSQSSQP